MLPMKRLSDAERTQVREAMELVVNASQPRDPQDWQLYWAKQFVSSTNIGGRNPPPVLAPDKMTNGEAK